MAGTPPGWLYVRPAATQYDAYPLLVGVLKEILMAPTTMQEMQAMRKAAHLLADIGESSAAPSSHPQEKT